MSKLRVIRDRKDSPDSFEQDLRGLPHEEFLAQSKIEVLLAANFCAFKLSKELMSDFGIEQLECFDSKGRSVQVFKRKNSASGSHKVDALYLNGLAALILKHVPDSQLNLFSVQNVSAALRDAGKKGLFEDAINDSLTELEYSNGLTTAHEVQTWIASANQAASVSESPQNVLQFRRKKGA